MSDVFFETFAKSLARAHDEIVNIIVQETCTTPAETFVSFGTVH